MTSHNLSQTCGYLAVYLKVWQFFSHGFAYIQVLAKLRGSLEIQTPVRIVARLGICCLMSLLKFVLRTFDMNFVDVLEKQNQVLALLERDFPVSMQVIVFTFYTICQCF